MRDINVVQLVVRWIHVLSFVTAVGGAMFMRLVLIPAVKESLSDDVHAVLRGAVIRRWKRIVHAAISLLLLTGFYNFYVALAVDRVAPMPYHAVFGVKLILALGMFVLAIGLSSDKAWSAALRRDSKMWLSILIGLGVTIMLLSGVLRQTHVPKPADGVSPQAAIGSSR